MARSIITYVGLGSNLGEKKTNIEKALQAIDNEDGIHLHTVSPFIETSAMGSSDQPSYVNAVAEIETVLDVFMFHQTLIQIETDLGRIRKGKWSDRTIDLDILLFGDHVIDSPDLRVPHQQMHLRSFVLQGLVQLNPTLIHPLLKISVEEMKERLNGGDYFLNPDSPQLICITGNMGVGKTTLAEQLGRVWEAQVLYEPYDHNPFMPKVYAGNKELALDSELYFLIHRLEQLNREHLRSGRLYITDYLFDNGKIYAHRLLDQQQVFLYERIFVPLVKTVTQPVLVIYLHDTTKRCLERIHQRKRAYEQNIQASFLENLSRDYSILFDQWTSCPVIRLDMQRFNCLDQNHINKLSKQIHYYIQTE